MIKYQLVCEHGHEFEGWFRNSGAYEAQAACRQISCPSCGTTLVSKAVMAPSLATRSDAQAPREGVPSPAELERQLAGLLGRLRAEVEASAEYVGPRFAEEARKIHYREGRERNIYGEARIEEIEALTDEGIPCLPLPRLPKDVN